MKCNWEKIKAMLSVCSGTKLKLRKNLLAGNYKCSRLCNFSGRWMYVYEDCMATIANKQKHQSI